MRLICHVPFRHTYGIGIRKEPKDIVAIRASTLEGAGNCLLTYEGRDHEGHWYPFFKKDNRGVAFPVLPPTPWKRSLIEVRGIRGVYKLISEEVPL